MYAWQRAHFSKISFFLMPFWMKIRCSSVFGLTSTFMSSVDMSSWVSALRGTGGSRRDQLFGTSGQGCTDGAARSRRGEHSAYRTATRRAVLLCLRCLPSSGLSSTLTCSGLAAGGAADVPSSAGLEPPQPMPATGEGKEGHDDGQSTVTGRGRASEAPRVGRRRPAGCGYEPAFGAAHDESSALFVCCFVSCSFWTPTFVL